MDHGFQCIHLKEIRRFILLLGIIFAAVMVVQHFELPYGSVLSSLLSSKVSFIKKNISPDGDLTSNSGMSGSSTLPTYTYVVHRTKNNSDASTSTKETNYANLGEDTGYEGGSQSDRNGSLRGIASSDSSLGSFALPPAIPVHSIASSTNLDMSLNPTDAPGILTKDEKKRPFQGNLNQWNSSSSVADLPAVNKTINVSMIPVMSISMMNEFLQQSRASPHSLPPQLSSKVDQELLYAKFQIEYAPILKNDDTELYLPLYHNASMFKRSYEIMNDMLKVYIYKEGEKPIFHDSILEGIYACEGWFLKLLEANKRFVTEDPREAHLFYLPFSSRLLELKLYVRHSHSRENLIQYMKNYVDILIDKYPFWNRTNGIDHFLSACHDWAPAETRGLMLNCIRALCNADIKTGFEIGKDVSIPTTYVQSAQHPLKDIGGYPPSQRPILAFFAGYMHGHVRPDLLKHWGNDSDMKIVDRMPHIKGNKNYIQQMKSSKYCICAKGFAVNSPRVVESIFYECVPVIISDNYVPPLFEVLDWESFAIFVLEKDIPNLKSILLSISEEKYIEMQKRVKKKCRIQCRIIARVGKEKGFGTSDAPWSLKVAPCLEESILSDFDDIVT